jgi:hypothetical protein
MKQLYIFLFLFLPPSVFFAQGYGFGVKGGLAIGNQRFDGSGTFDNSLLFKYQGDVFIESAPEDPTSVMYASLGYHVRGHARRYRTSAYDVMGRIETIPAFTQTYEFNNISLGVGFKRRNVLNREHAYYGIGVRGEYTINTNLEKALSIGYFPLTKEFVREFNFGMTLSGGYEFPFSDLAGAFVEFSVHPDITKQYFQPTIGNVNRLDPNTGQIITGISEQSSRNLSMEITIGFRFLRKIIYTD